MQVLHLWQELLLLVVGVAFLFWYMDAMDTPLVMRGVIIFVSILMFSVMMWFFMTLAALDDMLDLRGRIVRLRDRSRGVS